MRDLLTNQAAAERFHGERRARFEAEGERLRRAMNMRRDRKRALEMKRKQEEAPERISIAGVRYVREDLTK